MSLRMKIKLQVAIKIEVFYISKSVQSRVFYSFLEFPCLILLVPLYHNNESDTTKIFYLVFGTVMYTNSLCFCDL